MSAQVISLTPLRTKERFLRLMTLEYEGNNRAGAMQDYEGLADMLLAQGYGQADLMKGIERKRRELRRMLAELDHV